MPTGPNNRSTPLPRATVPRGERRRPPPAHRRHRAEMSRSHRRRRRNRSWRVRFAGFQLITAGPTDLTRDRRARPRTRRRVPDRRVAHRVHGEALQHRHTQPEAVDGECPRPGLLVRSDDRPDGHRHRQATARRPAPPPGRGALSTHPPTPADDTTSGSLERRKWSSDAVSARGKRTCGPQECLCGVDPSIERPIMVVRRRRRRECRHRDGPPAVWRRAGVPAASLRPSRSASSRRRPPPYS